MFCFPTSHPKATNNIVYTGLDYFDPIKRKIEKMLNISVPGMNSTGLLVSVTIPKQY